MINPSTFQVPTVVKHAPSALACLADEVKALGARRPLVVTDKGLVNAGLVNEAGRPVERAEVAA